MAAQSTKPPVVAPEGVQALTADQLRNLMQHRDPGELLLVDVRQPAEYEAEHLPGARLIPLFELEAHADVLRNAFETTKVFYCRSGARSARAAEYAVRDLGLAGVGHLAGGMLGWHGEKLSFAPNLRAFEDAGTLEETLYAALDLEKGAHRFYTAVHQRFANTPVQSVIERLAWVEVGHERLIYRQLARIAPDVPPFEEVMVRLRGDVLEDGQPLDEVIATAEKLAVFGVAAVLELALEIELRAFDAYRALAHRADDPALREAFLELAHEERQHARDVSDAIAKVLTEHATWVS